MYEKHHRRWQLFIQVCCQRRRVSVFAVLILVIRSLSDQYHGHDGNHKAVRQEVCHYLRENEETYKFFVEDDQSFEHHVECMSQDATFGGNMELVAFAKLKKVDIKVYQPGMMWVYISIPSSALRFNDGIV